MSVDFPVFIDYTYQQGKYDEEGVARHGYAVDAPFINTPRRSRIHYSRRFGIESSYRLAERSILLAAAPSKSASDAVAIPGRMSNLVSTEGTI